MDEESLGRGRQSVAHGVVAKIADVRAVDGSEVTVRLGRRQQAAGAAVLALGRERAEEGARGGGGDGVDEEADVLPLRYPRFELRTSIRPRQSLRH